MHLTCQQVISFLGEYIEGGLPAEVLERFEQHLKRCTSCVAYLATYRESIRMARAAAREPEIAEPAPAELIEAVIAAVNRS